MGVGRDFEMIERRELGDWLVREESKVSGGLSLADLEGGGHWE